MRIERLSPSMLLDATILRDVVPWLRAKAMAKKSFPGGHAITGFLFMMIIAASTNKRWTIAAAIITIPLLIMPRLVSGAHWLSDIVLGSFLVTAIPASWIFYSPLFSKVLSYVQKRDPRSHQPDPSKSSS